MHQAVASSYGTADAINSRRETHEGPGDTGALTRLDVVGNLQTFPQAGKMSPYEDLSQGSVRFGQPALAFTYCSAAFSISGWTLSWIGAIEPNFFRPLRPVPLYEKDIVVAVMVGAAQMDRLGKVSET